MPRHYAVMAGHSRPKDGVLSHAYVPGMTSALFNDAPVTQTCNLV